MHNNKTDQIGDMNLFWSPKKEASWIEAPASQRHSIIASGRAEFVTALDLDNANEDPSLWTYRGPLYLDFDAEDINDTIKKFKQFLNKLVDEFEIDLNQIALYASGKKGFHIEIPQALFMPRVEPMQRLPHIYKELAFGMYVDTLDLAVYTAKKGRMWRTPNFKRPGTGTYKVQLTPQEALAMTAESYAELVSAPRPLFKPEPAKTFNAGLALAWCKARDKAENSKARKLASAKTEQEFAARFRGYALPPSLLALAQGEIPSMRGWNQTCTQLVVTSIACGTSLESLLDLCKPLVQAHQSDGHQYNTPAKRRRELARLYSYHETSGYAVCAGGIRSILPKGVPCRDLRGLA